MLDLKTLSNITEEEAQLLKSSFICAFYNNDEFWKKETYAGLNISPRRSLEEDMVINYVLNTIVINDNLMEHIFKIDKKLPVLKHILYKFYEEKNGKDNAYAGVFDKYNEFDQRVVTDVIRSVAAVLIVSRPVEERKNLLKSLRDSFTGIKFDITHFRDEIPELYKEISTWQGANPDFAFNDVKKYFSARDDITRNYIWGFLILFGYLPAPELAKANKDTEHTLDNYIEPCMAGSRVIIGNKKYESFDMQSVNLTREEVIKSVNISRECWDRYQHLTSKFLSEEKEICDGIKDFDTLGILKNSPPLTRPEDSNAILKYKEIQKKINEPIVEPFNMHGNMLIPAFNIDTHSKRSTIIRGFMFHYILTDKQQQALHDHLVVKVKVEF